MANLDAPRGFTVIQSSSTRPYRRYYKDASVILGVGDPVVRVTNSSSPEGYPEVTRATTGAAITGVIVGLEPKRSDLSQLHMAAADAGYLLVCDDPDALFEVQDNGGVTGLVVADIGEHIDSVTAINANTVTGRSNYEIDTEAQATDNTWRLESLVQREDNVVGANAKWIVSANLHTDVNASASNKTEI
jgi:hypothetical protein